MVLTIILIRHGKTQWNIEKRYLGSSDQPLCHLGESEIKEYVQEKKYPQVEMVVASPMRRCKQTATLIYPEKTAVYITELREIFFGEFEGKTYEELKYFQGYIDWIDSQGQTNAHQGELQSEFHDRCLHGFFKAVNLAEKSHCVSLAVITHGGVMMQIMEHLAPRGDIYHWQVKNGCGFLLEFDIETKKVKGVTKI